MPSKNDCFRSYLEIVETGIDNTIMCVSLSYLVHPAASLAPNRSSIPPVILVGMETPLVVPNVSEDTAERQAPNIAPPTYTTCQQQCTNYNLVQHFGMILNTR